MALVPLHHASLLQSRRRSLLPSGLRACHGVVVMLRVDHGNVEVELSDYDRSKKLIDMILRQEAAKTDGRAEVRGEVGATYTATLCLLYTSPSPRDS